MKMIIKWKLSCAVVLGLGGLTVPLHGQPPRRGAKTLDEVFAVTGGTTLPAENGAATGGAEITTEWTCGSPE